MKRIFTLSTLLLLCFVQFSCTKYSFLSMGDKIIGTWNYDKVKNSAGLFKANVDITKNYQNWNLTFKNDGTALAYNSFTQEEKFGTWDLVTRVDTYYDEDGESSTSTDYTLYFTLRGGRGAEENHAWNVGSITAKKLRASENIGNGSNTYVLVRQN